jgi:hypothetical protein
MVGEASRTCTAIVCVGVKGNALAGPVQIHSQLIRSFTENRQEILF